MISGKIQYAIVDGNYILKFLGDVRLTLCSTLDTFAEQMFADTAFQQVIIDLSETDNIDSTSLGLLAKMSIKSRKCFECQPTIVSPREDITRLLLSMGFDQVFNLVSDPGQLAQQLQDLPCESCSEEVAKEKVIAAHRALMELNERNRGLFSDLVKSLESDDSASSAKCS